VYLANRVEGLKQLACKIVNLDTSADRLAQNSPEMNNSEAWVDRARQIWDMKKFMMREVKILSKLSHVGNPKSANRTEAHNIQPHIINLHMAFYSSNAL